MTTTTTTTTTSTRAAFAKVAKAYWDFEVYGRETDDYGHVAILSDGRVFRAVDYPGEFPRWVFLPENGEPLPDERMQRKLESLFQFMVDEGLDEIQDPTWAAAFPQIGDLRLPDFTIWGSGWDGVLHEAQGHLDWLVRRNPGNRIRLELEAVEGSIFSD